MIKYIIFDLGGVIVPHKSHEIERKIAKFLGIKTSSFESTIQKYISQIAKGEISLHKFYSTVLDYLGNKKHAISSEELLKMHMDLYSKKGTKRNTDILALVEKLKKNYVVACLTNTEIEIAELNRKNGLFDYFHKSFISCDMKMMKPDLGIYREVLKKLKAKPEETVFIDDKKENLGAASSIGINTTLYSNIQQLKKDLKGYSIIF